MRFSNIIEIDDESFADFGFVRVEFDFDIRRLARPVEVSISAVTSRILGIEDLQVVVDAIDGFFNVKLTL